MCQIDVWQCAECKTGVVDRIAEPKDRCKAHKKAVEHMECNKDWRWPCYAHKPTYKDFPGWRTCSACLEKAERKEKASEAQSSQTSKASGLKSSNAPEYGSSLPSSPVMSEYNEDLLGSARGSSTYRHGSSRAPSTIGSLPKSSRAPSTSLHGSSRAPSMTHYGSSHALSTSSTRNKSSRTASISSNRHGKSRRPTGW